MVADVVLYPMHRVCGVILCQALLASHGRNHWMRAQWKAVVLVHIVGVQMWSWDALDKSCHMVELNMLIRCIRSRIVD
jgi:hypothetical protein